MYFRCASCHAALWVEASHHDRNDATGSCLRCGREHCIEVGSRPAARVRDLQQDARRCAMENGIDLPAAYSIVAGILTLEQVIDVGSNRSPILRSTPAGPPAGAGPATIQFDEAFQEAVDAGHLTAWQAFERGNRDTFARALTARHGLPTELAHAVADNRMTLLAAVRARKREQEQPERVTVRLDAGPKARTQHGALAAALVVIVLLAIAVGWHVAGRPAATNELVEAPIPDLPVARAKRQAETASVLMASTRVLRDARGKVTQVEGPDPSSVLIAFCEAMESIPPLEPLEVVPAAPPSAEARLGLIRDLHELQTEYALPIRRSRETRRWIAGTGDEPLRPRPR